MKKPKYYCGYCGKKCQVKAIIMRYDTSTGKPKYRYEATCPKLNKMHWLDRVGTGHARNDYIRGEMYPHEE